MSNLQKTQEPLWKTEWREELRAHAEKWRKKANAYHAKGDLDRAYKASRKVTQALHDLEGLDKL